MKNIFPHYIICPGVFILGFVHNEGQTSQCIDSIYCIKVLSHKFCMFMENYEGLRGSLVIVLVCLQLLLRSIDNTGNKFPRATFSATLLHTCRRGTFFATRASNK